MALTIIEKPYETPQPVILDNIENNLRFVEISPNIEVIIEETKYYQSGLYDTNEDNKKLYGFDNFFNIYAISSDGRHFVTKEEKTLIFYKDGQIIKQYLLDELVTDLTKISNPLDFDSMGYYYWINKIKTDYESDYLYLETADNILYLFDFKTGEILASTSFSLDNHAATIVKQDGSESNIEQLHICDSIFRFMVETQDIDNLSFTGFLEQENKNEDSTFLVAFPFNEIEKIIRLEDKEPIFQVYFKNNPPLKIKPENTYQLCAVDKDKNSIKFTINEIKSITDLELIEYDALPGKQQQLTREQLDYYKKGESNSPWKILDLDNINHLI
ncbi:MAG: hypothetical protein R3321_14780, partial [Nitrososphaeraceae archaeon]|nr:hypothetical protein [Nitrososphaeraceae archaeon]